MFQHSPPQAHQPRKSGQPARAKKDGWQPPRLPTNPHNPTPRNRTPQEKQGHKMWGGHAVGRKKRGRCSLHID